VVREWKKRRIGYLEKLLHDLDSRGSALGVVPKTVTASTVVHRTDARNITNTVLPSRTAAAFYTARRNVIVIRADQVFIQIIAHEMCHAYAHRQWNAFQTAFLAFQEQRMNLLDEAVTSEVANLVLASWHRGGGKKRVGSKVPDGYAGYKDDVREEGAHFIWTVDKTPSTIGPASLQAYLAGSVTFTINAHPKQGSKVEGDRARLLRSQVVLGARPKVTLELKDLFP